MPPTLYRVKEFTHVLAPRERVFLLASNIKLVQQIIGLNPVEGKTSGLVQLNDRVVWRGWKFGLPAMHETLITAYEQPAFFQDTQGRGRFTFFQHDHHFEEVDGQTLMRDIVRFSLPFGPAGKLVAKHVMVPHILGLMQRRFALLKRLAEGPDWQQYIP